MMAELVEISQGYGPQVVSTDGSKSDGSRWLDGSTSDR